MFTVVKFVLCSFPQINDLPSLNPAVISVIWLSVISVDQSIMHKLSSMSFV